jgi:hypothetical protein
MITSEHRVHPTHGRTVSKTGWYGQAKQNQYRNRQHRLMRGEQSWRHVVQFGLVPRVGGNHIGLPELV